jgi:4-hydroxy-tetrahydrodipicolinate synthase
MLLTSLVTPFHEDSTVDWVSFEKLVQYQLKSPVDGIVVLGTTAETLTLSAEEQNKCIYVAIKVREQLAVPHKKIFMGVLDVATNRVVEKIKLANQLAIDGYLVACPGYRAIDQKQIVTHFLACDAISEKPIMLYNIPERTGVNILPITVANIIRKSKHIRLVKEASGHLSQIMDLVYLSKELGLDVQILTGSDEFIYPSMMLGSHGGVSIISNLKPKETASLVNRPKLEKHYKLLPIIRQCSDHTAGPATVKDLLQKAGIINSNQVRLPLVKITLNGEAKEV